MSSSGEKELREAAFAARNDLDEEGTEAMGPVRLSQMVSLRLDGHVVAALRDLATERGSTVSELLREAAALLLDQAARPARQDVRFTVIQGDVTSWNSSDFQTGWQRTDDDSGVDFATSG